jgi:hypothetical protein
LQELESFRRHDDESRKRTSAGTLAISTVTVKHHNRFCGGFVAKSRRKRIRLRRVWLLWSYIICVLLDGFRSFKDATNERVTSGQSFFAFGAVGGESISAA